MHDLVFKMDVDGGIISSKSKAMRTNQYFHKWKHWRAFSTSLIHLFTVPFFEINKQTGSFKLKTLNWILDKVWLMEIIAIFHFFLSKQWENKHENMYGAYKNIFVFTRLIWECEGPLCKDIFFFFFFKYAIAQDGFRNRTSAQCR